MLNKKIIFADIIKKGDKITATALIVYFFFGLIISYFYSTTMFALAVGGLLIAGFFALKFILPQYGIYRYYASAAYAIFMAQFIYQMHGMFEMHFFAFIGAVLLICYQDWKLQIPNILVVVVHHALFAWLQYQGNESIYFTQLQYMDLQTFIIHALLAAVIVCIAGYWAFIAEEQTVKEYMNAQNLNNQLINIEKNIAFAEKIKNGDFSTDYLVNVDDDRLGASLLEMRESLILANKREQEEKYINVGVANINEILRRNINQIGNMCTELVSQITKYLEANQAGIYLLESGDGMEPYLELKAHYAYNRKKYVDKKIMIGEGLVGQAYLEKQYTLITNLPDQYVTITSGLGAATPACLLIIPIQVNEIVVGILEIASFTIFENFQILFLQKACEAIGSTISSAKLAERTNILLEEAQQQSEQLKSQEEEMRQNLEEMQATQEEATRSSKLFMQRINAITNSDIAMIEFAPNGIITNSNSAFQTLMGYDKAELIGKHHRIFVSEEHAATEEYTNFWKDLNNDQMQSGIFYRIRKDGSKVKIKGAYSIIKNEIGEIESILKFAVLI